MYIDESGKESKLKSKKLSTKIKVGSSLIIDKATPNISKKKSSIAAQNMLTPEITTKKETKFPPLVVNFRKPLFEDSALETLKQRGSISQEN